MKKLAQISAAIATSFFAVTGTASAATNTANVTIELVSVYSDSNVLYVQTSPRHSLDSGCTSDFWLSVSTNAANFDAMLSAILTAQAQQSTVTVTAENDNAQRNQFCKLSRITLDK